MGLGGISIWQLLIILVIVLLLFGTKKLKGIGSDLGGAIKGFKDSMAEKDNEGDETSQESASIEGSENTSETKTADDSSVKTEGSEKTS